MSISLSFSIPFISITNLLGKHTMVSPILEIYPCLTSILSGQLASITLTLSSPISIKL